MRDKTKSASVWDIFDLCLTGMGVSLVSVMTYDSGVKMLAETPSIPAGLPIVFAMIAGIVMVIVMESVRYPERIARRERFRERVQKEYCGYLHSKYIFVSRNRKWKEE